MRAAYVIARFSTFRVLVHSFLPVFFNSCIVIIIVISGP